MVKTSKNLLVPNQTADDVETWYAALGWGHMTKMAKMPIYGKNIYKFSSLEQNVDVIETW